MSSVPETIHQCDEDLFDVRISTVNCRLNARFSVAGPGRRNSVEHSQKFGISTISVKVAYPARNEEESLEDSFLSNLVGLLPVYPTSRGSTTKKKNF